MTEIARITVRLSEVRAGRKAGTSPLLSVIEHALAAHGAKAALANCDECTIVYHGCGSCDNGGALVEYFCGSGGSQPDYTVCESCA